MTTVRYHAALQPLLVPADSVKPHPLNPNNGDTAAIAASILVNGCYRPVYASRATQEIVAGHHVYAALLELGAQDIPVMWVDGDTEAAVRLMVADNRTAALARMDDALLLDLLQLLEPTDVGLTGTGYTDDDLQDLLAAVSRADTPYADQQDGFTPGMQDRLDQYQHASVRYIVLGYAPDMYARVVAAMAAARQTRGLPDNSAVLADLLDMD